MTTILILGQDESFQDLFKLIFEDLKCNTIKAKNSDETIEILNNTKIKVDLIFVDRSNNENSVDLFVQHIRKLEPMIPIALFSDITKPPERLSESGYSYLVPIDTTKSGIKSLLELIPVSI